MPQPRKPQRYRLTWEFVLREPKDYEYFRNFIHNQLRFVAETNAGIQADYLAIEKVEDPV